MAKQRKIKESKINFTKMELQVLALYKQGKSFEEIAEEMSTHVARVKALYRSYEKKIETWYMIELPSFQELQATIEEHQKLLDSAELMAKNPQTPDYLVKDYKNKISVLKEKLNSLRFALNMGIKGFFLGKKYIDNDPEQKLYKTMFDTTEPEDEENEKE